MIAAVGHGIALSNSVAAVSHGLALANSNGAFRFQLLRFRAKTGLVFVNFRFKKLIKFQHVFSIVFGRFWEPSWSLLGGQNRPKMGQVGLKTALETLFFEKREFSRKALKTNEISINMTPRGDPKRPKIAPKRSQDGFGSVLFSHRFLSSILVGFGFDFGSLWAPFWEPKSVILGIVF